MPGRMTGAPARAMTWNAARKAAPSVEQQGFLDWALRDPVLKTAILLSLAIIIYQVVVMVLRPGWLGSATDWGRAGMAWIETVPVALAAVALSQSRKQGALAWWMFALAMLSYSIAQTIWAVLDQVIVPGNVPVPSWADFFYLLQYPFFFLALALLPGVSRRGQPGITRAKVVLDSLLLMAAGTALSWYFFLAPLYLQSGQSVLGKATNLAYPVGDLGLLFGLSVVSARQGSREAGRIALNILIASAVFLIIADSWFLSLNLYSMDHAGDPPDGFWIVCYLLFALAGLVQFRITQQERYNQRLMGLGRGDTSELSPVRQVAGSFRLLFPLIAAVFSSALIVFRAATNPIGTTNLLIPFSVGLGLIVLVMARQGITVLENERLLREEQQQKEELALAKQVAEEQRQLLAERNQRLERDIELLKDTHARVARGDYSARARIESGELLPIAGSLNLMLDRLSKLIRSNAEHVRLDQAMQLIVEAAQGLAMGDDRALSMLSAPTNTPLDGVAIALSQLRGRIRDLGIGLRQLELARKASRELTDICVQQGQFITNEGAALNGLAGVMTRLASELDRVAHLLEQTPGVNSPAGRPTTQIIGLLQMLARASRQQVTEIEAQVARFAQAEERANLAAIGGRRLAAELDAAARSGGSKINLGTPGMPPAFGGDAMPSTGPLGASQHAQGSGALGRRTGDMGE